MASYGTPYAETAPALPTAQEAYAATARFIDDILSHLQPPAREAISGAIYVALVAPLQQSAEEWQRRAVERRESYHKLQARWSQVYDFITSAPKDDEIPPASLTVAAYAADGDLPPWSSGLPFDTATLTPEQVDQLHQHRAHPDFDYATTEGPRETWTDANKPPRDPHTGDPGRGWELNTTRAYPDAFERFDHHEESYWRRRKADETSQP